MINIKLFLSFRENLIIYILLFTFCVCASIYFLTVNFRNNIQFETTNLISSSSSNSSSSSSKNVLKFEKVQTTTIFNLVTNFEKINPQFDLLAGSNKIYTLNSYHISNLCDDFKIAECSTKFEIVNVDSVEEVYNALKINSDNLGLLKTTDLDFRLKIVKVYQSEFDKAFDFMKYPLKIINSQIVSSEISDKLNQEKWNTTSFTKVGHTGSFLTGRGVLLHVNTIHNGNYEKMIEPMKPLFSGFDIMSATQETSLMGSGVFCYDCLSFVGSEKVLPQMVVPLGIDIVTMAANHIMDGGVADLSNTFKIYKDVGIPIVGASDVNNDEAIKPVLVDKGGLKIAYLSINDTPGRDEWADEDSPGAASASDWIIKNGTTTLYEPNLERIKKMVQSAKDLHPDLIILLPHWGAVEYQNIPTKYVQNLAHLFLDEGVDIIVGDHPHWVQEMEWYHRTTPSYSGMMISPIFYSVGNFVFDQMWSIETRQGMTVELNFIGKKLANIELHPHQLYLYDRGTVEPLSETSAEYRQTLERVFSVSDL